MSAITGIEWTDHTFNPWWGCTRVSPGCAHCYAATLSGRLTGTDLWKPGGARRFFGQKHWNDPLKWNRWAGEKGERRRVFCASMADAFEDHPELQGWREHLWRTVSATPNLDWQILTKRPENVRRFLPFLWRVAPQTNVWIGTSVEDQEAADRRIPDLLLAPAAVRFLSVEPLLESVNLNLGRDTLDRFSAAPRIDWVIVGGESGSKARPCDIRWIRDVRSQCANANVPCFVKQLGARPTEYLSDGTDSGEFDDVPLGLHDRKGGDPAEWPEDLRVREFPQVSK